MRARQRSLFGTLTLTAYSSVRRFASATVSALAWIAASPVFRLPLLRSGCGGTVSALPSRECEIAR